MELYRIFIQLWLAFLLSFQLLAQDLPEIQAVEQNSVNELPEGELKELLTRLRLDLVNQAQSPHLKTAYQESLALLKHILIPNDAGTPIQFVLINDLDPNAFFTKLRSGERVVGINLGLLKFIESKDELAFILGHELEHGTSQLQQVIDTPKSNSIPFSGLQRSVENEVDLKSVYRRVHQKGFNPYAAEFFFSA